VSDYTERQDLRGWYADKDQECLDAFLAAERRKCTGDQNRAWFRIKSPEKIENQDLTQRLSAISPDILIVGSEWDGRIHYTIGTITFSAYAVIFEGRLQEVGERIVIVDQGTLPDYLSDLVLEFDVRLLHVIYGSGIRKKNIKNS